MELGQEKVAFKREVERANNDIDSKIIPSTKRCLHGKLKSFVNSNHRASGAHVAEDEEIVTERTKSFVYSLGLSTQEAELRLQTYGKNEVPEIVVPKWYIFVSQLWKPLPLMMWVALIIEAIIENYIDLILLLFILLTNTTVGFLEITKAEDSVAALKKTLHPSATVKRDGKFITIDTIFVVPGDVVLLTTGSAVPADCRVNEGEIEIDEATLTGEIHPVVKYQGGECKMGSTVVRGDVEATVEATGAETFVGKTDALMGVGFFYFTS